MPNHYHLLVETSAPTLSLGMAKLNGTYAQRFNRRHERVGHVFQGRFHSVLVEREGHLLELARYVVLNPVRAGLCRRPGDWPWSSYAVTAGLADASNIIATDWILGQFGSDTATARRRYAEFVMSGDPRPPWSSLRGGMYLGTDEFAAQLAPGRPVRDVPRRAWQPVRPPLAELVAGGTPDRIHKAVVGYGYRLREVAAELRIHPTTVGRRLAEAEAASDV